MDAELIKTMKGNNFQVLRFQPHRVNSTYLHKYEFTRRSGGPLIMHSLHMVDTAFYSETYSFIPLNIRDTVIETKIGATIVKVKALINFANPWSKINSNKQILKLKTKISLCPVALCKYCFHSNLQLL